ncbi:MAG: hypothetical protein OXF45_03405 [Candidatus Dadabacteria bacterium]|nr:hypothetical protein [Candidatus Dadabacteria bacterium]
MKNRTLWKIVLPLTLFFSALAFLPAVIPARVAEPFFFGMPRTLWASMALSLCIYAVLVAAVILSKEEEE